jgi:hypothetical protein
VTLCVCCRRQAGLRGAPNVVITAQLLTHHARTPLTIDTPTHSGYSPTPPHPTPPGPGECRQ